MDRDRDGVDDAADTCIAGAGDRMGDLDGDELQNGDDPCPFDFEGTDGDADGYDDACDPHRTQPGDRLRCLMTFANPVLNRELWIPRGDPAAWNLLSPGSLGATATGAVVASVAFEAPVSTTFDVMFSGGPPMMAAESAITLWLRTGATANCAARSGSAASRPDRR